MSEKNPKAAIEAILFSMGEPVDTATLSQATGLEEKEVAALLDEMRGEYEENGRGIRLIKLEKAYQLAAKSEYYQELITVASHPKKPVLTDVMMETLAIIAYKQPVTRIEVEKIRGVKSDFAINKLLEYELIEELGRLNAPGRPVLFGTSEQFLRSFGLGSKDELPAMDPVRLEDFKAEAEAEVPIEV